MNANVPVKTAESAGLDEEQVRDAVREHFRIVGGGRCVLVLSWLAQTSSNSGIWTVRLGYGSGD